MPPVPRVSVVTPVYNGDHYLEELILSVQRQSHPRIEHIVIDDGSNDGGATVAILQKYPHLKWWTRPNKGQYTTLNEGMTAATGDWICIVSADDMLASPDALATLVAAAGAEPTLAAVYGRTALMDSDGRPHPADRGRIDESAPRWLNYHFLVIHHCSMIVSRRFIESNALTFDPSLRYTGDWDWIIRILKLGRTRFVDIVVSRYRVHEQQTRQTTARQALVLEDRLVLKRHGASTLAHVAIVNWFRARKLIRVLATEGGVGAVQALKRFFQKS